MILLKQFPIDFQSAICSQITKTLQGLKNFYLTAKFAETILLVKL